MFLMHLACFSFSYKCVGRLSLERLNVEVYQPGVARGPSPVRGRCRQGRTSMAPPEGRTAMALARTGALADTQGSRLARSVPAAGGRNDGFLRAVELDGRVVGEGADSNPLRF